MRAKNLCHKLFAAKKKTQSFLALDWPTTTKNRLRGFLFYFLLGFSSSALIWLTFASTPNDLAGLAIHDGAAGAIESCALSISILLHPITCQRCYVKILQYQHCVFIFFCIIAFACDRFMFKIPKNTNYLTKIPLKNYNK